jgi:hypothetical protein
MGWKNDKKNVLREFRPNAFITKAEFSTILSRMLYATVSNDNGETWFIPHLKALKDNGIIDEIVLPNNFEIRGNVLTMLLKASTLIK